MATAKKSTELAPVENFALTTAYDGLDPGRPPRGGRG